MPILASAAVSYGALRGTLSKCKEVAISKTNVQSGRLITLQAATPEQTQLKPLEYFWERFGVDEPYDEDRIREEGQAEAAEGAMGHLFGE